MREVHDTIELFTEDLVTLAAYIVNTAVSLLSSPICSDVKHSSDIAVYIG